MKLRSQQMLFSSLTAPHGLLWAKVAMNAQGEQHHHRHHLRRQNLRRLQRASWECAPATSTSTPGWSSPSPSQPSTWPTGPSTWPSQISILLTSCCWKKGSHWDDRGKGRNKEKRFKRLKKVHQRRKFVPFVNFLSFFESPSSINITNANWFMYCWSLHSIWKCTCQLESYWI